MECKKHTRIIIGIIGALTISAGLWQIFVSFPLSFISQEMHSRDIQKHLPSSSAVFVMHVLPSSSAEASGMRIGDIILKIDGEFIESVDKVIEAAQERAGQELSVEVLRGDSIEKITLVPRENPPQGEGALGIEIAEKEVVQRSIPKIILESYLDGKEHPPALTELPHRFIRLQALLFGIAWMVIGYGFLRLRRWSWYGYVIVTLFGFVYMMTYYIFLSGHYAYNFLDFVSVIISILVFIYIFLHRKCFGVHLKK